MHKIPKIIVVVFGIFFLSDLIGLFVGNIYSLRSPFYFFANEEYFAVSPVFLKSCQTTIYLMPYVKISYLFDNFVPLLKLKPSYSRYIDCRINCFYP